MGQTGAIELHKEWEHLRAERIGGTVRLLVDGKAILEYADPDPLPGGAVGLWTLDNGLTVARARVYHQGAEPVRLPEAPLSEALPLPALPLELTGPDHVAGSLKHGLGGWSGAQGTCSASLAVREGGSNDRCLLVSNPRPGGPFALRAPVRDLDLLRHPLLAFDCAIPPSVCVDAYLTVKGGRFRLRLTGPDAAPIGTEELGGVPGLQADGRWQHVEVDLLARLRPFYPPNAPLVLNGLEFANHGALEYLQAGIGGNPLGACYRLDNLRVGKMPVARGTRGAEGAPVWREAPAAAASGDTPLRCDFEADAGGLRLWDIGGGAVPRRTHGRALANPQGGNWCLEVVNSDIGGMFGLEFGCRPFDAARYPTLDFDYCAPDTLRVDLLLEVGGSRRIVKFTDNDATWPVIGSVGAVADGRWHHASVDLHALLRQAFPSATALPVTRLGLASSGWPGNRRGTAYWLDNVELRPSAAGVLAEALVQSPQDALPPAPPPVEYRPADCAVQTGFEGIAADDPAMWGNFLGCQVVRCAEGGASGPGCLELRDLRDGNGSAFALIAQLPRDWREHPRLRFRYRTRRGSPASLTVRGTTYDGVTDQWTVLASLPAAGGAWQDADVDLAAALDAAAARLTMHRIFLDVSISDPDEALLIDDYALQRPTATENGDAVQ
ncbi:MAG: hypothetical protein FJX74_11515 [Armatimonadetes bacterium]|nr:hypothetical protein [Armatimonadota bacterium]